MQSFVELQCRCFVIVHHPSLGEQRAYTMPVDRRRSGNALQAQQEWIKQLARSANAEDASRITVRPPASGVF
jgi:hypothetical protein